MYVCIYSHDRSLQIGDFLYHRSHLRPMGLSVLGYQYTKDLLISTIFYRNARSALFHLVNQSMTVEFLLAHVLTLSATDARIKILI